MANKLRFDPHWQRKRSLKRWWRQWRLVLVLAVLFACAAFTHWAGWGEGEWRPVTQSFNVCRSLNRAQGCVIDGDTIAIGQRRIRLTGYDAPELNGACENERLKAVEAQYELVRWLSAGPFELEETRGRAYDKYGRELRGARRGDTSLADHMIGMGLAEGSGFGMSGYLNRIDWCA